MHTCTKYLHIQAKASDCHNVSYDHPTEGDLEHDGYLPSDLGIGSGDYIDFSVCVECGKIRNWKPLSDKDLAEALIPEYDDPEE